MSEAQSSTLEPGSGASQPVRKTYSSRMKKKKDGSADATADPAEARGQNGKTNDDMSEKEGPKSTGKRIPKKVEVDLPPPSQVPLPKKPESTVKKTKHSRGSSVASVAASVDGTDATSSHVKPPSSRGLVKPSPSRSGSQDEGSGDDAVSVAGSVRSTRKRKTEPERIQFFKDDPLCAEVEPHRARCVKCDTWVPLHAKRKYVMQEWIAHRKSCPGPPKATPPQAGASGDSGPAPLSQMETEGKTLLENDSRTGEIRAHEVFCTPCDTWVPLDPVARYATANWDAHAPRCSGTATTSPQVGAVSGTDAVAPPPSNGAQPPSSEPLPVDMASDTPPTDKFGPSESSGSRKRARDEDEDEVEEGVEEVRRDGRVVRQRTETYTPARGEALWKVLTKPFRAFVEGFQQGLNMKPASSGSTSTPELN